MRTKGQNLNEYFFLAVMLVLALIIPLTFGAGTIKDLFIQMAAIRPDKSGSTITMPEFPSDSQYKALYDSIKGTIAAIDKNNKMDTKRLEAAGSLGKLISLYHGNCDSGMTNASGLDCSDFRNYLASLIEDSNNVDSAPNDPAAIQAAIDNFGDSDLSLTSQMDLSDVRVFARNPSGAIDFNGGVTGYNTGAIIMGTLSNGQKVAFNFDALEGGDGSPDYKTAINQSFTALDSFVSGSKATAVTVRRDDKWIPNRYNDVNAAALSYAIATSPGSVVYDFSYLNNYDPSKLRDISSIETGLNQAEPCDLGDYLYDNSLQCLYLN